MMLKYFLISLLISDQCGSVPSISVAVLELVLWLYFHNLVFVLGLIWLRSSEWIWNALNVSVANQPIIHKYLHLGEWRLNIQIHTAHYCEIISDGIYLFKKILVNSLNGNVSVYVSVTSVVEFCWRESTRASF